MGVKYSVSVGVNNFEFKDGTTSIGIAELLVNNFVPSEYHKELTVLIAVEKADDETLNDKTTARGKAESLGQEINLDPKPY